jgi:hypothetical protein
MKLNDYESLNYDKWEICSDACTLGEKLQVTVFDFLKAPLIRKYGEDWYVEALEIIEEYKAQLYGSN